MTTLRTSPTTDKRAAAAVALVESHLVDIKAHVILRRYVNNRVVWLVNGHVVTLDPVTCDCGDFQHRHPEGGCKHVQAVILLTEATAPARPRRPRTEPREELDW